MKNTTSTTQNINANTIRSIESLSFSSDNLTRGGFSYVYQGESNMEARGTNKCVVINNCEGANCKFRCGKSSE